MNGGRIERPFMPMHTPDRESLHIEIYVHRNPGSLSVSSYSDFETTTLDTAILEAQHFIKNCRRIKRDILRHGLGVAAVVTPEPGPSIGEAVNDAWRKMGDRIGEGPAPLDHAFTSSTLFHALVKR